MGTGTISNNNLGVSLRKSNFRGPIDELSTAMSYPQDIIDRV